ncbi:MAG: Stp1/IreP family PP2C-type Ser/Thr phosphatase, partial [Actinomycetota bacterium]|nr:Stp1/IreP family PP2C-type Ser/Thr phosphatase [Actinomycetota bacterium]
MKLTVGTKTDVGRHREANEDSFLIQTPLFGVADGMGGHAAGDVASATAVGVVGQGAQGDGAIDPETLAQLIRDANSEIWRKAQADRKLHGMGTTCTLVMFEGNRAHLAHVGDSRAYLMRTGQLKQLSEDHTLVARMAREGRIAPEEAQHHPQRNVITRALGIDEEVEVDLSSFDLEAGDRIMLCSDGLTSMLEDPDIRTRLIEISDPQAAAEALVDAANEAGGTDNITVVLIDVAEGDGVTDLSAGSRPAPPPSPPTDEPRATRADTQPAAPPDRGRASTPPPSRDDPSLTGIHRTEDLGE